MYNSAQDLKSDLVSTITIIRGDVSFKKDLLKKYQEEGDTQKSAILNAKIEAITEVLDEIDVVLHG